MIGDNVPKYIKRPIVVEAWNVRYIKTHPDEIPQDVLEAIQGLDTPHTTLTLWVAKAKKYVEVTGNHYIIRELDGTGFYPCEGAIFEETHVQVER